MTDNHDSFHPIPLPVVDSADPLASLMPGDPDPHDAIVAEIGSETGTVLVVGRSDTGKTTLVARIARAALDRAQTVAIIDSDVGQSQIGPPCAIGMSLFRAAPSEFRVRRPDAMAFVGSTQPFGYFLEMIGGVCELEMAAREQGAGLILVDTSGVAMTVAGLRLKQEKLLRLRPSRLILLERGRELTSLAQLARSMDFCAMHRIQPSPRAHVKPSALREGHRRERMAEYFHRAREQKLTLASAALHGCALLNGRLLSPAARLRVAELLMAPVLRAELTANRLVVVSARRPTPEGIGRLDLRFPNLQVRVYTPGVLNNLLVGLCDGSGTLLDLGIIQSVDFATLTASIVTPFTHMSEIRLVRLGALRLRPDGKELGALKPGEI